MSYSNRILRPGIQNINPNTIKINDYSINSGCADVQTHTCLTVVTPLKAGAFYEMTFNLQPDDQIIKKGQQIGLMIFSSDSEYTLLPKPGTELTIDLKGTK